VGAACAGVGDSSKNWKHLVLAIDPSLFGDRDNFINNVSTLIEKVKATGSGKSLWLVNGATVRPPGSGPPKPLTSRTISWKS
jgi:LDH2 family malate/lactate/ureidoglycolate dehydrogenase